MQKWELNTLADPLICSQHFSREYRGPMVTELPAKRQRADVQEDLAKMERGMNQSFTLTPASSQKLKLALMLKEELRE